MATIHGDCHGWCPGAVRGRGLGMVSLTHSPCLQGQVQVPTTASKGPLGSGSVHCSVWNASPLSPPPQKLLFSRTPPGHFRDVLGPLRWEPSFLSVPLRGGAFSPLHTVLWLPPRVLRVLGRGWVFPAPVSSALSAYQTCKNVLNRKKI